MKQVKLIQKSESWLEWRKNAIGSSDIAKVLGLSRYGSPKDVWESKTGRAFPVFVNEDMERGNRLEEVARHDFNAQMGKMFFPACVEHETYPAKGSYDALTIDNKEFAEIKAPRRMPPDEDLVDLKKTKPDYFCQIQFFYMINDQAEKGYLVLYCDGVLKYKYIPRDDDFINDILIPGMLEFWKYVEEDEEPPLSGFDYIYLEDADTVKLAERWVDINEQIKSLQEQEKALRIELADKGDDGNVVISDVLKMTRVNTKGRVNTKKLYAAFKITEEDLDAYRGEQIGSYRFTPIKI